MYDYLIVGAGLFGSVCSRELSNAGKECLIIDKRKHIGGNCYTENIEGINVHKYGAHIFHTSDENIWKYINKYSGFINYIHRVKVKYKNRIYSFPINLLTLYQLWGVCDPEEAKNKIKQKQITIKNPHNLEDWILSQVGEEIYNIFIKGYTEKQWQRSPSELPTSIIRRLPIRFTYNDDYFNDKFQGIPEDGYTKIFNNLLKYIPVKLNTNFLDNREYFLNIAKKIIYTGKIDEYFNYVYGRLEYRSLLFKHEILDIDDYQGISVINYPDLKIPFTRIIEHKHFEGNKDHIKKTIITREYPQLYDYTNDPYYPINDDKNNKLFDKYRRLAKKYPNLIFGGRLGEYKYYDMDEVISSALRCTERELKHE
ncbi:MAG TPA: UDP-galactopyranose mutase [Candidatus Paceibacterota bacterium]|nr:UDP-galactopyranose mutase [Candidatus Paceibacterota bacterium]